MKVSHLFITSALATTLLLTGCVEQTDKDTTQKNKEKETPVSQNVSKTKQEDTKKGKENKSEQSLSAVVSKQQEDVLSFLKVIELPNSKNFALSHIDSATVQGSPTGEVEVNYLFISPSLKDANLGVRVTQDNDNYYSSMFSDKELYTEKEVNGFKYYVYNSESIGSKGKMVDWAKNGNFYSVKSESLSVDELIEIAQTFKHNEELSNALSFKTEDIKTISHIPDADLEKVYVYSEYSVWEGKNFIVQSGGIEVYQTTDKEDYEDAVEGLDYSPESYKEVEISDGLKGIHQPEVSELVLHKGDTYYKIQGDIGYSNGEGKTELKTLIEIAKKLP